MASAHESSDSNTVRIVNKTRYDEQVFADIPYPSSQQLPAATVQVQTKQLALTSNNLTYCAGGTFLHWWDPFPVPSEVSTPYNDRSEYGIAPAWGYAQVVASSIPELPQHTWLFGFVPTSSHIFELELQRSEGISNSWIETSPHRHEVMPAYQRYFSLPGIPSPLSDQSSPLMSWTPVLKPIWEAAYVLEKFIFSSSFSSASKADLNSSIHPLQLGLLLSTTQANISDSLIVSLAAGTKTNRAFLELLSQRAGGGVPAAVVEVSASAGRGVQDYTSAANIRYTHKVIPYSSMTDPASFMSPARASQNQENLDIRKVFVFDYGARNMSLPLALKAIREAHPLAQIITILVGNEAKVRTPEETTKRWEMLSQLRNDTNGSTIQLNTSAVRTTLIEHMGAARYFEELNEAFEQCLRRQLDSSRGESVLGVKMKRFRGIKNSDGLKGGWDKLSRGEILGDQGVLVDLE